MIRILQLVACISSGGMEAVIMNYYRNLDRNQIQFDFLVRLSYQESHFYEDEIKSLGGKIYRIPFSSVIDKLLYPCRLYIFFIKHREYRIVHAHMDVMSAFYLFIAWLARVPVRIAHSHNTSFYNDWKGKIKFMLKPFVGLFATKKMACGFDAAKWLFGKNIDKVLILKNAIDTNKFKFNEDVRLDIRKQLGLTDKIVFGHIGHFELQKNHEFLIDVFNFIKKKNKDVVLLLLGDGSLENAIKQKVNDLSLNDNVMFLGVKKDVSSYLMSMDYFIFPSFFEGFSLALLEAQCSGLRCFVSSNIPPEINVTGLVSFLSIFDSPSAWCDYILSNLIYIREDKSLIIENKGLSIKNESSILMNFYLTNYI